MKTTFKFTVMEFLYKFLDLFGSCDSKLCGTQLLVLCDSKLCGTQLLVICDSKLCGTQLLISKMRSNVNRQSFT